MPVPKMLNPITVIPNDLKPRDRLGFKVIAVIGHNNDWAAYRGPTIWSDEQIGDSGDKIGQEVAELLFYAPRAAGLKYRR